MAIKDPDILLNNSIYDVLAQRQSAFLGQMRSHGLALPSIAFLSTAVTRLGDSNVLAFGDPEAPEPEVDESDMTASFTITTPARDRYGDVVMPRGCIKTMDQFLKNPQVFFGHKSHDLPIATSMPPVVGEDGVKASCRFHGKTPESACVFGLVAEKILRSTSIGFLPNVASFMKDEHCDEDGRDLRPKKASNGEEIIYFDGWAPLRFLEWTMLEWSVVSIPANPECTDNLTAALSRGKVGDSPIPSSIRRSLEPFALKARVWSPGFDPTKSSFSGVLKMAESDLEYAEGKLVRVGEVKLLLDDSPPVEAPVLALEEPAPKVETVEVNKILLDTLITMQTTLSLVVDTMKSNAEEHRTLIADLKGLLEKKPEPVPVPVPVVHAGPAEWELQLLDVLKSVQANSETLKKEIFKATGRRMN